MPEISEEDFSRFQNQLLDLREKNYSLEDKFKKQSKEVASLTEQCSKQTAIIKTSKKASEAENLTRDNNLLRSRLRDQEEDFKLQNNTLLQELTRLVSENENLEQQMRELCQGISSDNSNDTSTDDSKHAVLLRTELSLHEKKSAKLAKDHASEILTLNVKISELSSQNVDLQKLLSQHSIIEEEGAISLNDGRVSFKKLSLSGTDDVIGDQANENGEVNKLKAEITSLKEKITENEATMIVIKEKHQQELRLFKEKYLYEISDLKHINESLTSKLNESELKFNDAYERAQQLMVQVVETKQDINATHTELNRANETIADQAQQLSNLELNLNELSTVKHSVESELKLLLNEKTQLSQQLDITTTENKTLTKNNEKLDKTLEDKRSLIQEMKDHMLELEKEHEKKIENLENKIDRESEECQRINEEQEIKISSLQEDLTTLKPLGEKVEELERENMMMEEKIVQVEEELSTHKDYWQMEKEKIDAEAVVRVNEVRNKLNEEKQTLNTELEIIKIQKQEIEDKNSDYEKQLSDAHEERIIQERRGLTLLKDVKKQVTSERRRADKLQDKLKQLLDDPSLIAGFTGTLSEIGDDVSSVSSWSMVSGEQRQTDSNNSVTMLQSPSKSTKSSSSVSSETSELLTRMAGLQESNWQFEEQIQHLESSAASMAHDIITKSQIIQHYCLQASPASKVPITQSSNSYSVSHNASTSTPSKSHSTPQSPFNTSISTPGAGVRRFMSRMKEVGEEVAHNITSPTTQGLERDTSRRLQAMLEETLLKNINLYTDVENLSQQVKTLTELLTEKEEIE